ncbi:hypothetical protein PHYBLDRAFT_60879 [Phycomyces blakesleeanus NRRL 1555(-)]|uniref:Uncharacterized protein n=1 Tax=Phycomyces blakesleeanus (strain ATCC 8743b / DSM 1359 / FGSC 10004 / NBRC 33097 / NRRL 1555) TaxID=763407 RepID=A0A167PEI4_PHYB8|nr:hypothetical protein PHYBLDRAFT_60879 [Phycomyces blakesleeanus NRRL 1555(-)]OAD77759.1 hypothetical protein PHYBLDRAFT_60879 [Phycomyces blakesleeanus NRRL 1555(-)]|eukprot:XP_018295799.1 hypothetical protein PHYBLDRAFT_60879 [Phycomyces blakesleeanus NRRL 1555(-)]
MRVGEHKPQTHFTVGGNYVLQMPDKIILEEASYHQIKDYLKDILFETWSNMNMIQKLSQDFYFNKEETTKSTLKQQLSDFWDQNGTDSTNSKRIKYRAEKLRLSLTPVVDSRPVSILIKKNLSEQEKLHFKAGFSFNDKHVLDLSKARAIPSRFKDIIDSVLIDAGLQLHPRLTISEYDILIDNLVLKPKVAVLI